MEIEMRRTLKAPAANCEGRHMKQAIESLFITHPRSARQSYLEHLLFAWRVARVMAAGCFAALIHGLLPCVLQSAAGDRIRSLYALLDSRGENQP